MMETETEDHVLDVNFGDQTNYTALVEKNIVY
jgi:hypothetical protein